MVARVTAKVFSMHFTSHILTQTQTASNNKTGGKIWLMCRSMHKKSIWRGNSRDDIWKKDQQQRDESEENRIQSSVAMLCVPKSFSCNVDVDA